MNDTASDFHELIFDDLSRPGWGFSFICDEKGEVDVEAMPPIARGNFLKCQRGIYKVSKPRVVKHSIN